MQAGQPLISVRRGRGAAESKRGEFVSGNYFITFGVRAFAGRLLADADDQAGAAPAVVMSYQTWQSDYAGDPSVIGDTFYLQSQPVTIVGIAPLHSMAIGSVLTLLHSGYRFQPSLCSTPRIRFCTSRSRAGYTCWGAYGLV